jgi:Fe-S-cluster containining protein
MSTAAEIPTTKPRREDLAAGTNLCDYCTAKCCRYFALPIETPETRKDFEFIRWYLLHDRATVFTEDDDWYLLVHTTCRHLQDDQRCGIYETRPPICREYSTKDCEYDDEWTYDRYFERAEQVAEYIEAVFPLKRGKNRRSPQPQLLPIVG